MHYVIWDLETTGFSPRYHEIIQIAALRGEHGRLLEGEVFETCVRAERGIPKDIVELTGLTRTKVDQGLSMGEAITRFADFAKGSVLVAHNGWRFDSGFIQAACRAHGRPMAEVRLIDTLWMSKALWGNGVGHSLDDLVDRLSIRPSRCQRHDARGDVLILTAVFQRMLELLALRGEKPETGLILFPVATTHAEA